MTEVGERPDLFPTAHEYQNADGAEHDAPNVRDTSPNTWPTRYKGGLPPLLAQKGTPLTPHERHFCSSTVAA
jgi:hypothetical protein